MENNRPQVDIESLLKGRGIDYIKTYSDENQKVYKLYITSMLDTFVQLEYDEQGTDASFYTRMPQMYQELVNPLVWLQESDESAFEDVLDEFVSQTKKLAECFFKVKDKLSEIKFIFKSYDLDYEDFISTSNNFEKN